MNKDKDWREVVINIVLIGTFVVGGLYGLGFLAEESGDHIVKPLIHAVNVYTTNYWRGTAEIFVLVMMAGLGIRFHDKIVRTISEKFVEHLEKLESKVESLTASVKYQERENEKIRFEADELHKKIDARDTKIKMMRDQALALQDEIVRLKDPESHARQELIEEKKANEASLKEIADSIRWGSV
jgi:hypothetical protein